MQDLRWVQMGGDELDDFLGRGGTGTISFSTERDEPPFSVPVSYGYDASTSHFYFRLAFPPDSEKEDVIDRSTTFVTHRETDAGYRSVVAAGRLEEVSDMPYDSAAVQGMWAVRIPTIDIFERPREEVPFRDFRLVPDVLTGRKGVKTED